MEAVLNRVSLEIIMALSESLPKLGPDWWDRYVIEQLTPSQQGFLRHKEAKLNSLDLSAAIRVFTRNFVVISDVRGLSRDCKSFAFQVLDIRNRHAHRTIETVSAEDNYRDLDTVVRFLELLKADSLSIEVAQEAKKSALIVLTRRKESQNQERRSIKKKVVSREKGKKPLDNNSVALSKREALALVASRTGERMKSSSVTFSNINKATGNWWFEPSEGALSKELLIMLNDHVKKVLYMFKIPANIFLPIGSFFYVRPDNGRSSIHVDPDDVPLFRDIHPSGPGKVSFGDYLIDSIEY